uniref:NADP-dependent oxidoreductase domain-containing protein n=1 Tax=Phaeomonas parva TaxID=124430 RepID=A0A6U4CED9_9STRA|mmetsp:Transcript_1088/g.3007  ORF Transcript_1088/g.3007 Transcript_1088/m.3007 type:complete len:570 (+) Transcript_1088:117-1826(+)
MRRISAAAAALLCAGGAAAVSLDGLACRELVVAAGTRFDGTYGLTGYELNDRPVYLNSETHAYLYHQLASERDGVGRWMVGATAGSASAIAFIDSWAVLPTHIAAASPRAEWRQEINDTAWHYAGRGVEFRCADGAPEPAIYVSSWFSPSISGIYAATGEADATGHLIWRSQTRGGGRPLFLYGLEAPRLEATEYGVVPLGTLGAWRLGEEVGSDACLAFSDGERAHVVRDGAWVAEDSFTVAAPPARGGGGANALEIARWLRNAQLQSPPPPGAPRTTCLAANVRGCVPAVGLGTGGLQPDVSGTQTREAVALGYRLVDTASAYGNEREIGAALEASGDAGRATYVLSKVWPTELGYRRTLESVYASQRALGRPVVDLMLLHWPRCYADWPWMDCSTVDPDAAWPQSWRALERLYAEGVLFHIGASNFDAALMEDLLALAAAPPQLLQNFLDPLQDDAAARELCAREGVIFQAYAATRNLDAPDHAVALWAARGIAGRYAKTPRQVILRWLLQRGVAVLPRTSRPERLAENLDLHDWALAEEDLRELDALSLSAAGDGADDDGRGSEL